MPEKQTWCQSVIRSRKPVNTFISVCVKDGHKDVANKSKTDLKINFPSLGNLMLAMFLVIIVVDHMLI